MRSTTRLVLIAAAAVATTVAATGTAAADEEPPRAGTWCADHGQPDGPLTQPVHDLGEGAHVDYDVDVNANGEGLEIHGSSADVVYFLVEPATCAVEV